MFFSIACFCLFFFFVFLARAVEVNGTVAAILVQGGRFRAPHLLTRRGAARQRARVTRVLLKDYDFGH
ncbi:hypothetical protein V6Z11_A05G316900 [Gossypium hirsutum]